MSETNKETFCTYALFYKRRKELEASLKYFVDSSSDRRQKVFELSYYKATDKKQVSNP